MQVRDKITKAGAAGGAALLAVGFGAGTIADLSQTQDTVDETTLDVSEVGASETLTVNKEVTKIIDGETAVFEDGLHIESLNGQHHVDETVVPAMNDTEDAYVGGFNTDGEDDALYDGYVKHVSHVDDDGLVKLGDERLEVDTYANANEATLYRYEEDDNLYEGDTIALGDYTVTVTFVSDNDKVYLHIEDEGADENRKVSINGGSGSKALNDATVELEAVEDADNPRLHLKLRVTEHELEKGDENPLNEDYTLENVKGDRLVFINNGFVDGEFDDTRLVEGDTVEGLYGSYALHVDSVEDDDYFVGERVTRTLGGGEATLTVDEERVFDYTTQDLVDDLDAVDQPVDISLDDNALILAR